MQVAAQLAVHKRLSAFVTFTLLPVPLLFNFILILLTFLSANKQSEMTTKITCNICDKQCRKKQKFKQCSVCQCFTHQKCTNLSPSQFSCISDTLGQNSFTCQYCTSSRPTSIHTYGLGVQGNDTNTM